MLRTQVESGKHSSGLGWDHAGFVVFACEFTDCIQRIESHDRDKLDLIRKGPTKELDIFEPSNLPILDASENLFFEKRLVDIGIVNGCPTVPNAGNHDAPHGNVGSDAA
jgi:hypothetical protein